MPGPPESLRYGDWHYEHITDDLLQVERVERVVFAGATEYQSVAIYDTACFGRTLVLDGKTQSTELDEFVYHEALVHPAMVSHPDPRTCSWRAAAKARRRGRSCRIAASRARSWWT